MVVGATRSIGFVNARPRPLSLYYFGSDAAQRHEVLARTMSGNVTINNTLMHFVQEDLPFGGIGPSGMGAYHGIEGLKALSHGKGIYRQWRWSLADLIRPPHGSLAAVVLKALLR